MLHTALLLLLAPPPMVGDLKTNFDSEMKKAIALAEAIPEEKYGYRPAANVRTTGEVLVHIMQPAVRAYYNLEELWSVHPKQRALAGK